MAATSSTTPAEQRRISTLKGIFRRKKEAGRKIFGWFAQDSGSDNEQEQQAKEQDQEPVVELSNEDLKLLLKALQRHFLFSGLDIEEQNSIVARMRRRSVGPGDLVFSQGAAGDCLYIVGSGSFIVEIGGRQVKTLKKGEVFGELALLYNVNRTATVTCSSESTESSGVLWSLDAGVVQTTLRELNNKNIEKIIAFLSSAPNFSKLSLDFLEIEICVVCFLVV